MELTQLVMRLDTTLDSSIIMIGEFVLDDQLVIKEVRLCQNNYGNYFLRFPESRDQRIVHPIRREFYEYLLSEVLADYHKKRSILGRKADEEKDCEIV